MTKSARTLGALALLGIISACGPAVAMVQQEDPFTRAPVADQSIRLHVQNLNFNEARLYALGLGSRTRLGIVQGKRNAVFSIPWDRSEPLRIEIDILSGSKCTTREIDADPGDTLDLQIEEDFFQTQGCG